MRYTIAAAVGIGGSLVILIALLLVFGLSTDAFGQSIPVHEAELGEIDKSLNYPITASTDISYSLAYEAEEAYQTMVDIVEAGEHAGQCYETNARLYAMVKMVAEAIARQPKLGYIYIGALNTIHSSWCT